MRSRILVVRLVVRLLLDRATSEIAAYGPWLRHSGEAAETPGNFLHFFFGKTIILALFTCNLKLLNSSTIL